MADMLAQLQALEVDLEPETEALLYELLPADQAIDVG
jgi:hypothetical protein